VEVKWTVPVHSARNTFPELKEELGSEFVCMPLEQFYPCSLVEQECVFYITMTKVKPLPK
jgi:hypothetical protein